MSIELTVIIAILGSFMTAVSVFNMIKKDNKAEGITQGQLSNDLNYVKRGIDSIVLEQKDASRELAKVKETLIATQNTAQKAYEHAERAFQSANNAHARINKMTKKDDECD